MAPPITAVPAAHSPAAASVALQGDMGAEEPNGAAVTHPKGNGGLSG